MGVGPWCWTSWPSLYTGVGLGWTTPYTSTRSPGSSTRKQVRAAHGAAAGRVLAAGCNHTSCLT
jgi:hypothetical protein